MVANLIATALVIAIHYGSKTSIQSVEIGEWNYLFQEFTLNGIARIAVPFFALISGFFVAKRLSEKIKRIEFLKIKLTTLLMPYLIASLLIFVCSSGLKYYFQHDSYEPVTITYFIKSVVFHPISIQFWYLRDLLILTFIAVFIMGRNQIYYNSLLALLFLLWIINYQPFPIFFGWYLLNIETFLFFVLGGSLFCRKNILDFIVNASVRNKIMVLFIWVLLLAIRVYIDPTLDVWYTNKYTLGSVIIYKLSILLGICSLIQLSVYLHNNKSAIYLSGLTFFAYLFHLIPLSYFRVVTERLVTDAYAFYLNFPIALLMVFFIAHTVAGNFPKIFAILTGGRDPSKALKRTH
jgi:Acyltransferase family